MKSNLKTGNSLVLLTKYLGFPTSRGARPRGQRSPARRATVDPGRTGRPRREGGRRQRHLRLHGHRGVHPTQARITVMQCGPSCFDTLIEVVPKRKMC